MLSSDTVEHQWNPTVAARLEQGDRDVLVIIFEPSLRTKTAQLPVLLAGSSNQDIGVPIVSQNLYRELADRR